jgi:hypothetical protein
MAKSASLQSYAYVDSSPVYSHGIVGSRATKYDLGPHGRVINYDIAVQRGRGMRHPVTNRLHKERRNRTRGVVGMRMVHGPTHVRVPHVS